MTKAQGSCDPRFRGVEQLFQSHLDSGAELGAAFYVSVDGRPAIDLYGGHADAARTRAWGRTTITTVWSTTKTISALAAIVLIDRGQLNPDAPVATYWPEFGAAGKEGVLVRHILAHTSGVPSWDKTLLIEEICDRPKSTALLAFYFTQCTGQFDRTWPRQSPRTSPQASAQVQSTQIVVLFSNRSPRRRWLGSGVRLESQNIKLGFLLQPARAWRQASAFTSIHSGP